jgi:hypothetical protein
MRAISNRRQPLFPHAAHDVQVKIADLTHTETQEHLVHKELKSRTRSSMGFIIHIQVCV